MECTSEAFELRSTTWDMLKDACSDSERDEIEEILGCSLIEQVVELQQEVQLLLDIWRDYRVRATNEKEPKTEKILPEPPHVRESLEHQIKLFVKLLDEKNSRTDPNSRRRLSKQQSAVVDYVMRGERDLKRPPSALSSFDGRETPVRSPTSASSRSSSSLREDVAELWEGKQNEESLQRIENLADQLREALLEDKACLESDIALLQGSLMNEADYQLELETSMQEEPTLKELKDTTLALEQEALKGSAGRAHIHSRDSKASTRNVKTIRKTSSPDVVSKPHGRLGTLVTPTSISLDGEHSRQQLPSKSAEGAKSYGLRMVPSPPTTSRPSDSRKSSPGTAASRFRKMVLDCRNPTT